MRGLWIALVLLVLLVLAWLFLRKRTATAPVAGSQYVPAPTGGPAPNNAAAGDSLTKFAQDIFTNKTVGNAICGFYGANKIPGACAEVNKVSQATVAASVAVGKSAAVNGVQVSVAGATAPVTVAKDIANGNVKGAAGVVVTASVAPAKAAVNVAKAGIHAVTSLF